MPYISLERLDFRISGLIVYALSKTTPWIGSSNQVKWRAYTAMPSWSWLVLQREQQMKGFSENQGNPVKEQLV
jgi:hypothetical protein